MIKTSPSNGDGGSSVPQRELRFPDASWPRNRSMRQRQYCNKLSKHINSTSKHSPNMKSTRSVKEQDDYTPLSVASISQSSAGGWRQWQGAHSFTKRGHLLCTFFLCSVHLKHVTLYFLSESRGKPLRSHILIHHMGSSAQLLSHV